MLSTTEQGTIRAMIREHQRAVEALSKLVGGNGVEPVRRKRRSKAEMLVASAPPPAAPSVKSPKPTRKRRRRRTKAEMEAARAAVQPRRRLESTPEAAE